jgi:hypothetical protein
LSFAIQTGKHATSTGFHGTWALAKHSVVGEWEGLHSLGKGASSFARGREAGFDFLNSKILEARAKHLPKQEAQRVLAEAEAKATARQAGKMAGEAGHARAGHGVEPHPNGLAGKPKGARELEEASNLNSSEYYSRSERNARKNAKLKEKILGLATEKDIRKNLSSINEYFNEKFNTKSYIHDVELDYPFADPSARGRMTPSIGKGVNKFRQKIELDNEVTTGLSRLFAISGEGISAVELAKWKKSHKTAIHETIHANTGGHLSVQERIDYFHNARESQSHVNLTEGFTEGFAQHLQDDIIQWQGLDKGLPEILGVNVRPSSYIHETNSVKEIVNYIVSNSTRDATDVYAHVLFNSLPTGHGTALSEFIWENHLEIKKGVSKDMFVKDMASFIDSSFVAPTSAGKNIIDEIERYK